MNTPVHTDLIAMLKEAASEDLPLIVDALGERFAPSALEFEMARVRRGNGSASAGNPFAEGLMNAAKMPDARPPNPIHFGIYPGRVTLFVGEMGAGKSSYLYNVAIHAALGESLFDFDFPDCVRVLYLDPENSGNYREGGADGGLSRSKLDRIGKGLPLNLFFHDGRGVNLTLPDHMAGLTAKLQELHVRLSILDPIATLFNTEDENNNAEAARQGKALTVLSRETAAAVVACHHTGKDNGGIYGRGASARMAAADVGVFLRVRSNGDEQDDTYKGEPVPRRDIVRVQIVKDRPGFFGRCSKYLRMVGEDCFELATFADWQQSGETERAAPGGKQRQAVNEVRVRLLDREWHSRTEIVDALKAEGIGEHAVAGGLRQMVGAGEIEKQRAQGRGGGDEYRLLDRTAGRDAGEGFGEA